MKSKAINISVEFSHGGKHYGGVSLHDGVNFKLVDAPCGVDRKLLSFSNTKNPPSGIFFDCVSGIDDKSFEVPSYLQLKPEV